MAVDMAAALSAEFVCSSRSGGVIGKGGMDSNTAGIGVGRDGEIGVNSCAFRGLDMGDMVSRSSIFGCRMDMNSRDSEVIWIPEQSV